MFGCCKTFSGKYIFSGNVNFRKRKMIPCVWLHFKKFSGKYFLMFGKEEGKHKSENTSHNLEKKIINDHNTRSRSRHDRDHGAIAIRDSDRQRDRDRRRDRDLAVRLELELAISDWIFSSRACALSLSLSLIFRKCFEGKIEV